MDISEILSIALPVVYVIVGAVLVGLFRERRRFQRPEAVSAR